jgi:uncharacterized iron-regulated membrane protein
MELFALFSPRPQQVAPSSGMSRRFTVREICVLLHRYVGLATALFLIIAGLTGSFLAFYHELDTALSPHLYRVAPPAPDAQPLDPFTLRERVEALVPDAWVHWVPLHREPGEAATLWAEAPADPVTKEHAELENDEFFLNPYTGEELGRRKWGDITQGTTNLMPFLYKLHYSLAIPGNWGTWLFGIAALLWTLDNFVGFYLTLPVRRRKPSTSAPQGKSFWQRWKPAWQIKWNSTIWRVNFDLHRAFGLWLWVMLFVFAWSSVGLNLNMVYRPLMGLVFDMADPYAAQPDLPRDQAEPGIPWRQAHGIGQQLMAEQAAAQGFSVHREESLSYDGHKGLFRYRVKSDRDITDRWGSTAVLFDANTGEFKQLILPTGQSSGNTVTAWLYALHFGAVFGLPYRIFVSMMGLIVVLLSITGVVIWLKKRQARHRVAERQATLDSRATHATQMQADSPL